MTQAGEPVSGTATKRLLVTGSRHWTDDTIIRGALIAAGETLGRNTVLVHGACRGADQLASQQWRRWGLPEEKHPVTRHDWDTEGKRAGPARNQRMVAGGADLGLVFPSHDSLGAWQCADVAYQSGVPLRVYYPDGVCVRSPDFAPPETRGGSRVIVADGSMFDVPGGVDMLVNPVNTVGVMGKGLAEQFKKRYPAMFTDYQRNARQRELFPGRMCVWENPAAGAGRFVVNFPTKTDWRKPSKLVYVAVGLTDLRRVVDETGAGRVAVPALGCGLGCLGWGIVEQLVRDVFAGSEATVFLYPPR